MNSHFLSRCRPYIWYPQSKCPPQLNLGEEMSYQMILFIDLVGVVAGFYDHEKKRFCKICERYLGLDDEPINYGSCIETINNNLLWTHEPIDKVLFWMLIPAPALPRRDQGRPDFWLN